MFLPWSSRRVAGSFWMRLVMAAQAQTRSSASGAASCGDGEGKEKAKALSVASWAACEGIGLLAPKPGCGPHLADDG
jgi:hypothetical protein